MGVLTHPRLRTTAGRAGAALLGVAMASAAFAQSPPRSTLELRRLPLEALMDIDVDTVSRVPEDVMRVPAAIYVITQEDIARSGASSVTEALRLAPGMQVARINAGIWAIGVRGFADRLARSMLVLIDGRAVYSPLFAGTYWETQDMLLADIDRIEVIRGPGGTLWGANAVNGIINIITKSAKATVGSHAVVAGGTEVRGRVGVRYGASAGPEWSYRLYGKALDRESSFHADARHFDGFRLGQGGGRADWSPSADRSLTVQGDVYGATLGQRETITTFTAPFTSVTERRAPLAGGNVLARWTRPVGSSRFQVQSYYARTSRDERPVGEVRDTFDVDVQLIPPVWRRHRLVWGFGYRLTSGRITATAPSRFDPPTRTDSLVSGFVQDEISLQSERLRLTLGSKFERNDYSGFEAQPGARLLWTPTSTNTLWLAVTSAVRTPSRVETDYSTIGLIDPSPVFARLSPNPAFAPERLVAYEAGYRTTPVATVFLGVSSFYNRHRDVLSTEVSTPFSEPAANPQRVILPVTLGNGLEGESYGVEVVVDARSPARWRWTASYSYARIALNRKPGSMDFSQEARNEGASPRHQVQLRSSVDLTRALAVDASARFISGLPAGPVPAYGTFDLRVGWKLTPALELAVVGQDLAERYHVEWFGPLAAGIERSGFVQLKWRR